MMYVKLRQMAKYANQPASNLRLGRETHTVMSTDRHPPDTKHMIQIKINFPAVMLFLLVVVSLSR